MCNVCARLGGDGSPHRAAFLEAYRAEGDSVKAYAVNGNGTNHIDSLVWGYSWTGNTGQSALNITYSFETSGAGAVPAAMQYAYVNALNAWAAVANVTFQFTSDNTNTDILFLRSNLQQTEGPGVIGLTTLYPSGDQILYTDVDIDRTFNSAGAVANGTLGFLTLLHEVGHSLGLKHSGDYGDGDGGPFLPSADDHIGATVMSYNDKSDKPLSVVSQTANAPISPMIYDVAAIQYLYGANTTTGSGNTTYRFDGVSTQTLWDASGTDVIDAANRTIAVTIDLREGLYNYSKIGNNFIWNAFGSNIENAIGGSSSDKLFGNSLANNIIANGGNDSVMAGGGTDAITAGLGNDTVYGDAGDDSIYGGLGLDRLFGGDDNDLIYGDNTLSGGIEGADRIEGGNGNDTIDAGGGNDTIYGDAGNDSIVAGAGLDQIYGGTGNDTMTGGAGNDTFWIQALSGSDVITDFEGEGVAGGDVLRITRNVNGSGIINFTTFQTKVTYGSGTATIDLGSGHILLVQNVLTPFIASDILIA